MAKFGLGKGLGALIPEHQQFFTQAEQGNPESPIRLVPLSSIEPNPDQPRKTFDQESLNELAESIRRHGLLQPLLVYEKEPERYFIIAGERRYRAAKIAGLSEIPVIVRASEEDTHLELSLVENIQREDLDPIEEAQAYLKLMDMTGSTQEQIAEMVGKSRAAVANALRLLKLPESIRQGLQQRILTPGHARALLAIEDPSKMLALYERVVSENLSVRQLEHEVQKHLERFGSRKKETKPETTPSQADTLEPELRALRERLIERCGTKIEIKGDSKRGTITIHYYSSDDLQRIYDIFEP